MGRGLEGGLRVVFNLSKFLLQELMDFRHEPDGSTELEDIGIALFEAKLAKICWTCGCTGPA